MKILNQPENNADTKSVSAAVEEAKPEEASGHVSFNEAIRKSVAAVNEKIAEEKANSGFTPDDPIPDADESVDVSVARENDPVSESASSEEMKMHLDPRIQDKEVVDSVKIEMKHKDAFVESVITGERYRETFNLLGGKLKLVLRSRSSRETEAIMSYARRKVALDEVRTDYDYAALMRKAMAASQVDELNGVKYPELQEPLFFEETSEKLTPPGWEPALKLWGDKPESLLSMIVRCAIEFEARYWEMVRKVNDRDFWEPEESTGA